jgi:membrane-associated protease RseP (regulator of RpoE activity)
MSSIIAISTLLVISLALLIFRKHFSWHSKYFPLFYFGMYRTKLGLNLMTLVSQKFNKLLKILSWPIIILSFVGMFVVSFDLIKTISAALSGNSNLSVGLVLPFEIKGAFYVPLFYWLISILFIAIIHEFSHGVFAKFHKIPIKSSGFAFVGFLLPLIPAAFVEPNEKILFKSKAFKQLSVFSAGPFINIFVGFILMAIYFFVFVPVSNNIYDYPGVEVTDFFKGDAPIKSTTLQIGEVITAFDNTRIGTVDEFTKFFDGKKPGDSLKIATDKSNYEVILSGTKEPTLGVFVEQAKTIKISVVEKYGFFANLFIWFKDLFYWLFFLNLGVGFFNLVPIGPLDGGRMLHILLQKYFPHKHKLILHSVSTVFVVAIVGSLVLGLIY